MIRGPPRCSTRTGRTRRRARNRLLSSSGVSRCVFLIRPLRLSADQPLLQRTIDLAPATDPATEMLCLCIDFGANQKDAKSQPTTLSQARKVCVCSLYSKPRTRC